MSDDLVKRLRRFTGLNAFTQEPVQNKLNVAAADRIEELEAKLAKAITELRVFTDASKFMQSCTSHEDRKHNTIITDTLWSQWSKQLKVARRFLEELSSEGDN